VPSNVPIGRMLVERKLVNRATVEQAAVSAPGSDSRLCSRLLEAGACSERDLVLVLAERHGVPGVDLSTAVVDLRMLDMVPQAVAEADHILPLSMRGGRLHLAVASPDQSARVLDEVRFVTGLEASPYVAVLASLRRASAEAYAAKGRGEPLWRGAAAPLDASPGFESLAPSDEAVRAARESMPSIEVDLLDAGAGEVVAALPVAASGGPKRVLVVDDEPTIRLLAQRALEHHGFAVEAAADGEEALAKAQAAPPDLVLLDAMLPRLHGFEVARRLRCDPRTRAVPIVMMTAVYRGWRFAQDARESYGAQDYLEKPFRVEELVRRIQAVLEKAPAAAPRGDAQPAIERGRDLLVAGRLDEAIAALEAASTADPFSAEAQHLLGKALRARGDHFGAMTALERAIDLRPELFAALRSLAGIYLETGFRRKAAETLERAIRVAPDDATREAIRAEILGLL
jgi:DNA-binding response OmpR family regulator